MGGFKLSDFIADTNKNGVLKENKFIATFVTPDYLRNRQDLPEYSMHDLSLRCESATIPGLQFASVDGPPRFGYGPIEFNPYNVVYEDVYLTVLLDAKGSEHRFFYDWMNTIVNFHAQGQSLISAVESRSRSTGPVKGMKPYEVGYRDKYSTNFNIDVYHDTDHDKPSLTFTAYNSFPKIITPLQLSWEATDLLRLQIIMTYTDFEVEYKKIN
jgi:hypothetical protein